MTEPGYEKVTITLPTGLRAHLREIAKAERRPMRDIVAEALVSYLGGKKRNRRFPWKRNPTILGNKIISND